MDKVPDNPCSIARSLGVLGERWTLLIIRDAFDGVSRFADFRKSLGIASDVLSDRLATLVAYGVLEKTDYQPEGERRRSAYRLTDAGRELFVVLMALQQWGDEHLPWADGASLLRHETHTGEPVRVGFLDAHGHEVPLTDVMLEPTAAYPQARLAVLRAARGE